MAHECPFPHFPFGFESFLAPNHGPLVWYFILLSPGLQPQPDPPVTPLCYPAYNELIPLRRVSTSMGVISEDQPSLVGSRGFFFFMPKTAAGAASRELELPLRKQREHKSRHTQGRWEGGAQKKHTQARKKIDKRGAC